MILINLLKTAFQKIYDWYKVHGEFFSRIAKSKMTTVVIFGLLMITFTFSFLTLSVFLFFLFWVSIVYQILNNRKNRSAVEPDVVFEEGVELYDESGKKKE